MNIKTLIIPSLLSVAALIPSDALARSPKRGVSESNFQYKAQIDVISQGVSWFYNWGPSVGSYLADQDKLEFVPMCWNGNFNADKIRDYVKSHPGTGYLLGFNEPNFNNQANMTPQEAAERWPEVQALAKELNLELVAPAMNYSPNAPYQSPTKWFDEFVALVGEDAFDYLAIHSYGGFGVMEELATTFHDRYHKPVWVTEFCFWPGESQSTYVAPETQITSMIQSVTWLEKTDWIFRYAWFMATGNSSSSKGPNYGLILPGKGEDPRDLSDQGLVYTNLPTYDPDFYNKANEMIGAQYFFDQSGIVMGASRDRSYDFPIQITRFNAGAYVDYKFDLTSESAISFVVRASGYGEPTRFDPTLALYLVDEDGNEGEVLCQPTKITNLPNSEDNFIDIALPIALNPGRHTLRLKDTEPSEPSGINISGVKLLTPSSVDEVTAAVSTEVNVYSIDGRCVISGVKSVNPLERLPVGIYIVNGKKLIK